jgi:hypothetical protein
MRSSNNSGVCCGAGVSSCARGGGSRQCGKMPAMDGEADCRLMWSAPPRLMQPLQPPHNPRRAEWAQPLAVMASRGRPLQLEMGRTPIRESTLLRIASRAGKNVVISIPARKKIPEGFRYGLNPQAPDRNGRRIAISDQAEAVTVAPWGGSFRQPEADISP